MTTATGDYRHRRIAKKVWVEESGTGLQPVSWRLTKDLRFVYDGWQMIAELDATFATDGGLTGSRVNRTFLWGQDLSGTMTGAGGVGGLLSTTYQGVTYQVCSDANGNVTGLVPANGPDAGKLIARFDYDPFGNRVTNTGPDVELCPMGFSTQYTDSETGLVAYIYRYYNPQLGRWPSRDPIGERGGINLYGMVGNDPVNRWDYLGLIYLDFESNYADENGDPKSQQDMHSQAYNDGTLRDQNEIPSETIDGTTFYTNGQTFHRIDVSIPAPERVGNCYVLPAGKVIYNPSKVEINTKRRAPMLDYYDTLGHEYQHVRAMISRVRDIIYNAETWNERFPTYKEALEARAKYLKELQRLFKEAKETEARHETGDGHGTPPPNTPVPFRRR